MRHWTCAALAALMLSTGCSAATQTTAPQPATDWRALVHQDTALGPEGLRLRDPSAGPDALEVALAAAALRRQGAAVQEPRSKEYRDALARRASTPVALDLTDLRHEAGLPTPTDTEWRSATAAPGAAPLWTLRAAAVAARVGLTAPPASARTACPPVTDDVGAVELATYAEALGRACAVQPGAARRLLDAVREHRRVDAEAALVLYLVQRCGPCGPERERAEEEAGRMLDSVDEELRRGTSVDTATLARLVLAAGRDGGGHPAVQARLRHVVRFEGRHADSYEGGPLEVLRTAQVLRAVPDARFPQGADLRAASDDVVARAARTPADVDRAELWVAATQGVTARALPAVSLGARLDVPALLLRLNDGAACPEAAVRAQQEGSGLTRLVARGLAARLAAACGAAAGPDAGLVVQEARAALTEDDLFATAHRLQALCSVQRGVAAEDERAVRAAVAAWERRVEQAGEPWQHYSALQVWGAVESRRLLDGACAGDWWRLDR